MNHVSVIVPVYNGAAHLGETLDSIAGQTSRPKEVIVVDDCSSDDSDACVRASAAVTTYIRNQSNRGVCHSRNVGIAQATGDLIAFSDHDDLWHPKKLEQQIAAFRRETDVDFLFTNFRYQHGSVLDPTDKFSHAPTGWWSGVAENQAGGAVIRLRQPALPSLLQFQPVFPSTVMVRRELLDRAGGFDEALGRERSEDLEFLLRCDLTCRMAALTAPLVTVRRHGQNFSADTTKTTLSQIRILAYVLANDVRYEPFRSMIEQQLLVRSINAFNGAFAAGDLPTSRSLVRSIPLWRRDLKLHVKAAVATMPDPIARMMQALLLS